MNLYTKYFVSSGVKKLKFTELDFDPMEQYYYEI